MRALALALALALLGASPALAAEPAAVIRRDHSVSVKSTAPALAG